MKFTVIIIEMLVFAGIFTAVLFSLINKKETINFLQQKSLCFH